MKQKINNLVETFGEPTIEVVSELFLEGTAGALIPGLTSVLGNIRTKRLERNLMVFSSHKLITKTMWNQWGKAFIKCLKKNYYKEN